MVGYPRAVTSTQEGRRFSTITRTAAQTRVLDAAIKLIAERGVSGTSLQMIADEMGVTKAAVYRQFKTKEEIVIAITEREMSRLEDALEAAEAEGHGPRARELLLERMIDQAVDRRGVVSTLQFDPVIIRLQAEYEPFQRFIERLYAALLGTEAGVEARLHAAMLSSAISVAVMHPLLADIDGETLRVHLKEMIRRMLKLPEKTQHSAKTAKRRSAAV
jgi:AcrR family transcriptional regulator